MKWYWMATIVVAILGSVVYMGISTDKFVNEKHTKTPGIESDTIQNSLNTEINNFDDIFSLINKADTLYHVEYNYVESLRIYLQVIEIQSTNIVALNGAGYSLMQLNQNVDAIEYFDTVLSIDDINVPARMV